MGNLLEVDQLVEDTSIANRAMKAILHRGVGAGRRTRDAAAENLVKQQMGDEGQIVTRRLFAGKTNLIFQRNQLAGEMYAYHMKMTLPHGDDGSRLLPNSIYMEYSQAMAAFETQLRTLDLNILATYDQLVRDDIAVRNAALMAKGKTEAACEADYPSASKMHEYLYVDWHLEPISTAHDFRYEVDDAIRDRLDERLKQIEGEIHFELFERMVDPMKRFVEKLSVPIGGDGGIFRDSLVGNLNELSYLRKLNLNADPRVNELLDGIEAVIKPYVFAPDVLREVPEARSAAKEKMAELVRKLDGYGFGGA